MSTEQTTSPTASPSTATPSTASPSTATPSTTAGAGDPGAHPPTPGAGTLALLAFVWLVASTWVVGRALTVTLDGTAQVTQAALALPAVIPAGLVAGTAAGLATVNLLAARMPAAAGRLWTGLLAGVGAGALVGLAVAAPLLLRYAGPAPTVVLWLAVVAAAAVGGMLAGVRPKLVIAAGVAGALGVFVVGFVEGLFGGDLLNLFGAGETAESQLAANAWVALTASLAAGLAAGGLSYLYLRRCGPLTGAVLRWPAFLAAGAMPGLLVLLAETITRLGGTRLFQLVSAVSADDQTLLGYLNAARFNRALIVLFVGALLAIFLFGRTLRPVTERTEEAP